MPAPPLRLVLASGSPRRKELLGRLVERFDVIVSGAEEQETPGPEPDFPLPAIALPAPYSVPAAANPVLWGWRKAHAVAVPATAGGRAALILGADTIVVRDDEVLGKPRDAAGARGMLGRLAGRAHFVVSGWALLTATPGPAGAPEVALLGHGYVHSRVEMAAAGPAAIAAYVATGEPLDKAGAYAVQGLGGRLVRRVEGCYTAVVGLPLCAIRDVLAARDWPLRPGDDWCAGCAGRYCRPAGATHRNGDADG